MEVGKTYIVQDHQLVRPAAVGAADGVENTIAHYFWQELLNKKGEETAADDSEVEVVDHKGTIEDEGFSFLHKLSTAKNYDVVCGKRSHSLSQGRANSLAAPEPEILGGVPEDGGVAFREDGPQFDAERAVEGRK